MDHVQQFENVGGEQGMGGEVRCGFLRGQDGSA
jgi:hypothetical protein